MEVCGGLGDSLPVAAVFRTLIVCQRGRRKKFIARNGVQEASSGEDRCDCDSSRHAVYGPRYMEGGESFSPNYVI